MPNRPWCAEGGPSRGENPRLLECLGIIQLLRQHRSTPMVTLRNGCRYNLIYNQGVKGKAMSWATQYISQLQTGETVQFRPRGGSMSGKIESGQLCTVEPVQSETLKVGDIVLCKVNGSQYLHLIKAIQGARFQIGNNKGRINGWITANSIYGRCVRVE